MNREPFERPGFGLGLRTAQYQDFLQSPQPVDWLEIVTDNFLVDGGKPLVVLESIRRDYPVAMHGVAMSLGSASGLDFDYLARVRQLARRIEPMWVSDHLCWTGHGGAVLHDLYPMPYTEESARLLIRQIRQAQDFLERRLVVENVSSYIRFTASTASEWDFLAYVVEEADCDLLLDVNNVYVSSINHGFDPMTYLDALPARRVRQIHLAGHSREGNHIIDTHDQPVAPEVWSLYAHACRRFPQVATMIERDDRIPPLRELIAELEHARHIAASTDLEPLAAKSAPPAAGSPLLLTAQRDLAGHVLHPEPEGILAEVDAGGPLPGARGLAIYHRAYRERLCEVLADSFAKCALYMGTTLFKELAWRYADSHPPQSRHLGGYGAGFPDLLASCYPGNPELADLARLEWHLREVFDSADVRAWSLAAINQQGASACLAGSPILHPSLRIQSLRSNAVAIWRAIEADENVPEVVHLDQAQPLAVWRKGLQPHFKTLDPAEARFLQGLFRDGSTISEMAQAWGESEGLQAEQLGRWLAGWWQDELLRC